MNNTMEYKGYVGSVEFSEDPLLETVPGDRGGCRFDFRCPVFHLRIRSLFHESGSASGIGFHTALYQGNQQIAFPQAGLLAAGTRCRSNKT